MTAAAVVYLIYTYFKHKLLSTSRIDVFFVTILGVDVDFRLQS